MYRILSDSKDTECIFDNPYKIGLIDFSYIIFLDLRVFTHFYIYIYIICLYFTSHCTSRGKEIYTTYYSSRFPRIIIKVWSTWDIIKTENVLFIYANFLVNFLNTSSQRYNPSERVSKRFFKNYFQVRFWSSLHNQ